MKTFIHEDFLLTNRTAVRLYHQFAESQPVIDFHCHLSPEMIANDAQFRNLTEAWLSGDHYKWRAMRSNGVPEKYCTGDASDEDKFVKWAETVPFTPGNPLYHWTHLELARYFEIYELLSPTTAESVYERANTLLRSPGYSIKSLLKKMNVSVVCTTDDPADSLEHHIRLRGDHSLTVLPTFRPDNLLKTDDPSTYITYINKLAAAAGTAITDFDSLLEAIDKRHGFFHETGCRVSDHGLDRFYFDNYTQSDADASVKKLLSGSELSREENEKYKTAVMAGLCRMNHRRGWTQQFHVGAIRNNNSRMLRKLGPDTGWDSIGASQNPALMSKFLNLLDETDQLARTILYNLNPSDNEMMITMAGNFNDGSYPAKVQYGAAWWFLDQKNGMEKHFRDLASLGILRRFVGMVTDSRSFLSYPRHEYFRRLLCDFVGGEVEKGCIPDDDDLLRPLIEGIAYENAKHYFGF